MGIATGKVCLEKTVNYCCFNSKLARIIQEQGRPQLGRSFGDPKNPDCSGLTIGDIMKIDFSKVDFSEFIADIKPKLPNPDKVKQNAQNQVNQGNITQQQVEQNNNRSRISPKTK
jgi:conjugal transfer mating pair stabilization protein TraN